MGLQDWLGCRSTGAGSIEPVRARSCILIWLDGGPSHLETFDLKPDAPAEVRGPFQPIRTNVPGILISEYLPETAKVMDKIAIIRSMTSTLGEHNFASHYLLTGYKPTPALVYPGMPAVVSHLDDGSTAMPSNVALDRPNAMAGSGYLGSSGAPFVVSGDPSRSDFRVQDLSPAADLAQHRQARRRRLRDAVDDFVRGQDQARPSNQNASAFDQAYDLIASAEARQAFDLDQEPATIRARYGAYTLGQSCLMARRLVEAGTKFVTVTDRGWDTHEQLFTRLKEGYTGGSVGKIPKLDTAYSALVADLAERGLLDTTLVILMGEFGRTPKLNPSGGRDHWPRAFSVALAGGGIQGGQVIGRSDSHGEQPADRPVTPADLVRTIYNQIGIDGDHELRTSDGRPVQINRDGRLIHELIS
ncbi:hypothetical protein Pla100_46670 [Neorhodopirellula pilleata]|uniref:Sulfatase n=2 Tax=Neorhodopirellula pilleata TaxID=2714738 RepID=A0A5C6A012_9BACT|nr:hypothetical protein Pla100_46670 [Neorhodopirellula pilleata]